MKVLKSKIKHILSFRVPNLVYFKQFAEGELKLLNGNQNWKYLLSWTWVKLNISYIVAVSFIGGGNRSSQRKPLTCRNDQKKSSKYSVILWWSVSLVEEAVVPGENH